MKTINYSKSSFQNLEEIKLPSNIINTEAKMYKLVYKGQEKVLKKLHILNGSSFANKLITLELLDTYREYLPENFCIPDYLFTVNNEILGYTMPYIKGENLSTILHHSNLNNNEKVYYLKRIGEILYQLDSIRKFSELKEFYISDLHDSNILVDTKRKDLTLIDIDSCKILNNIPNQPRFLSPRSLINNATNDKYQVINKEDEYSVIANEQSDLYCYNIIILNFLFHGKSNISNMKLDEFKTYLDYLEAIGHNKDFVNSLRKLPSNDDNENPLKYLDTLNDQLIYRSNERVFNSTKEKILNKHI